MIKDRLFDSIHERVKNSFDLEYWHKKYLDAVSHRRGTWDEQAEWAFRVRENEIPEKRQHLPNEDDYSGRFYKDNIIYKHIKWMVSDNTGSLVHFDLKNILSIRDANTEILESKLNQVCAVLDLPRQTASALYDGLYTGMGYVRRWWDKKAITLANKTGQARITHVPCMKIFIDHTTHSDDKSDMKYIFHLEKFYWKYLAKKYPKLAKKFKEKQDNKGLIELVTVQFRVDEVVKCVTVSEHGAESLETGENPPLPPFEKGGDVLKEWIMPLDDWTKYINSGADVPEGIEVDFPYDVSKTFWYEAVFFPDLEEVISKPEYVGEFCSYHIFSYAPRKNNAYDVGLAHYMKDMQDINVVLLTVLVLSAYRHAKQKEIIYPGMLLNANEYIEHGHKIGVHALGDHEAKAENPNTKPVELIPKGEFAQELMVMNALLTESQKNISGVSDTVVGDIGFAGESGVSVAQRQTAGKVYHMEEKVKFQQFLCGIARALSFDFAEYCDKPMLVEWLDENNQHTQVSVNDPHVNDLRFEPELVSISCQITENVELVKQMQQEREMILHEKGLLSGHTLLETFGISNPGRELEKALQEKGILDLVRALEEHPELREQVEQAVYGGMAV